MVAVYGRPGAGATPSGPACYAAGMARGWESKAIESQQQDRATRPPSGPDLTPAERERHQRAESVALALADAAAQLQAACRPAHRDALHQRVTALQNLLAELRAAQAG